MARLLDYYSGMFALSRPSAGAPILPSPHWLGHQRAFATNPLAIMLQARAERGDLVRLRFGPFWLHLLSDPAEAHAVMVEKHKQYSKRTPGYDLLRIVLGNGLVTSEGELWRRQRRIAQPAFHRKRIAEFAQTMLDAAAEWTDTLAVRPGPVDIAHEMATLTLRIAGETLFGFDLTDESEDVSGAVADVMAGFSEQIGSALPFLTRLPTRKNKRRQREIAKLDALVHEIIAERRRQPGERTTLLNLFIGARDDNGEGMSDMQLRDEVLTMLLAGHETTANALTWTFFALSKHPEICRRVTAEIDSAGAPSFEGLGQMRYLSAVLKESLRLYPPVWTLGRRAEQGDTILGYDVPKGALVLMSPYVIHRHPDHWENPQGFDPERWLGDHPAPARGAYMPFAVGPRKCIGEHFAVTEALLVLWTLLARYRPELLPGRPVEIQPSVTLRARNGIIMRLMPR